MANIDLEQTLRHMPFSPNSDFRSKPILILNLNLISYTRLYMH